MNNISSISNCYGCGMCAIVCTKKIISIELNKDGFYEPHINAISQCTNCGLCSDICAFLHMKPSLENPNIHSYASWSNDPQIRYKCSSGGIGFELGRTLIKQGYKVCSVRYNILSQKAEHYIATTVEELLPSIGSKYIQSYTVDGFKAINRKEKYLVTGAPCQIDSFRRYIQKFKVEDNFVLMDFFCHGVPSMHVWQKYLERVKKKVGRVTYASWRDKLTGWHDSWVMKIDGENCSINTRWSQGDLFYKFFLSDGCLGKACYIKCKYKYRQSSADIRIGDLWGKTFATNEEGVSAVVSFTQRGDKLLKSLDCTLKEYPFETVAEGQIKTMLQKPLSYSFNMALLRSSLPINIICLIIDIRRNFIYKLKKIIQR